MPSPKIFGIPASFVFWVLFSVLIVPSGIFVYQSFNQLDKILKSISQPLESKTKELLLKPVSNDRTFEKRAIVALELDVMIFRQHRATTALATRTWMRFMSLIFGAILIVIGSAFILGRIGTTEPSTGTISLGDVKGSLVTSSPGLLLVFFGGLLIAVPNLSEQKISINDTSSFIGKIFNGNLSFSEETLAKPSETAQGKEDIKKILENLNSLKQNGANK